MSYKAKSDLPESVEHILPPYTQGVYKEASNSVWDQYKDKGDRRDNTNREETTRKMAWAVVEHEYIRGDDDKWYKRS